MIPDTNMSHGVPKFHLLPTVRDPHIHCAIQQVPDNSVPLDPVYHCASFHPSHKNRFHRGNEGDRLRRPAEVLRAERHADTDGDVHPSGSLLQAQGQATVSVMPILTLQIAVVLVKMQLTILGRKEINILLGQSLKV